MPSWTVIGNVASPADIWVDGRGHMRAPAGWTLGWWAIASDGFHRPGEDAGSAVTQRRIDGTPVLETSLRVPGGQLQHRVWCVADTMGAAVVVELENRSREPVGVALVVGGVAGVAFDGERTVAVNGSEALVFARVPARAVAGTDDELSAAVTPTTAAPQTTTTPKTGKAAGFDGPSPGAAFVFPLAHTARLRAAIPLGGAPAPVDLARLADAEQVVAGWLRHVDAGARVSLPDDHLAAAIVAARTTLLVRGPRSWPAATAALVARALDAWGHHDAARAVMEGITGEQRLDGSFGSPKDNATTAAVLGAWAGHARATSDGRFAEELVEPVAKAAHRLGRRYRRGERPAWFAVAQHDAADVLALAGQPDAAARCRQRADGAAAPPAVLTSLDDILGPRPDDMDVAASARLLLDARRLLLDDGDPATLRLLPSVPDGWLGQNIEAHRLPTRTGLASFAVRWHGARPALLWELEGGGGARLTIPGLDGQWASAERAGEALLGPVEPAGGLPKVLGPLDAEGTPVDEVTGDGVSFT